MIPYWTFPPTILLCVALGVILGGCAEPYWIKVQDPILVTDVRIVAKPCGKPDIDGCAIYSAHRIELRAGMPPTQRRCVFTHELKHFDGYTHRTDLPNFATDCGDGELL